MSTPLRVVVVDDDFMVVRLHREFVGRIPGFEVVGEARSGQEALRVVASTTPDVVLLDVYLPDLSGIQVLERLRAAEHPVDVVMITAARDAATVAKAMRFGAVHYLIKPFGVADLAERLRQVAEARQHLSRHAEADLAQADVDRVFRPVLRTETQRALPKGLSQPTMDLVVERLRSHPGPVSAASLAEDVGLSRVSVRRYLEHLVALGWADVSLKYGSAGRPERLYRRTGS